MYLQASGSLLLNWIPAPNYETPLEPLLCLERANAILAFKELLTVHPQPSSLNPERCKTTNAHNPMQNPFISFKHWPNLHKCPNEDFRHPPHLPPVSRNIPAPPRSVLASLTTSSQMTARLKQRSRLNFAAPTAFHSSPVCHCWNFLCFNASGCSRHPHDVFIFVPLFFSASTLSPDTSPLFPNPLQSRPGIPPLAVPLYRTRQGLSTCKSNKLRTLPSAMPPFHRSL